MRGIIPPTPQYVFMVWCLVKLQNNFTHTFDFNSHVRVCLRSGFFTAAFPAIILYAFLISHMRATRPAHVTLRRINKRLLHAQFNEVCQSAVWICLLRLVLFNSPGSSYEAVLSSA